MATTTITGIDELVRMLKRGEKAPAKVLTQAAKAGSNIVRSGAKGTAPVDTGRLRRSIKLKAEKRRTGKKVYQIAFIGDGLVKEKGERTDLRTKKTKGKYRYFYPASQEYGWKKPSGGKAKDPPSKGFMRKAIQGNRAQINNTMVETLVNSLRALGW